MDMPNFTARRTDSLVLSVIKQLLQRGERIANDEIAAVLGCDRKTVIRSVQRLEAANVLRVSPVKGKPNRYELIGEQVSS